MLQLQHRYGLLQYQHGARIQDMLQLQHRSSMLQAQHPKHRNTLLVSQHRAGGYIASAASVLFARFAASVRFAGFAASNHRAPHVATSALSLGGLGLGDPAPY